MHRKDLWCSGKDLSSLPFTETGESTVSRPCVQQGPDPHNTPKKAMLHFMWMLVDLFTPFHAHFLRNMAVRNLILVIVTSNQSKGETLEKPMPRGDPLGLRATWSNGRCPWPCQELGTRCSLRSLSTQPALWFKAQHVSPAGFEALTLCVPACSGLLPSGWHWLVHLEETTWPCSSWHFI